MPDITMCNSTSCPLRPNCYRNEASGTTASNWQSFAAFHWNENDTNPECHHYWPVKDKGTT